jgi:hypothetical protein
LLCEGVIGLRDGWAIVEYNTVIDLMTNSLTGLGAQKALQRVRGQQGARESEG